MALHDIPDNRELYQEVEGILGSFAHDPRGRLILRLSANCRGRSQLPEWAQNTLRNLEREARYRSPERLPRPADISPQPVRRHPTQCGSSKPTRHAGAQCLLGCQCFYHLTHKRNLRSILHWGILSLNEAVRRGLHHEDISDPDVQRLRNRQEPVHKRFLHDYASLYFNPKNPMLYKRREMQDQLVILCISLDVLTAHGHVFADGNAAHHDTMFSADASVVAPSKAALTAPYWTDVEEGKRRRCAEVLVYPRVEPQFIVRGLCKNPMTVGALRATCALPLAVDKDIFF